MWIIQEILHAEKITVWCGSKKFDWKGIETLYLKLKTVEDNNWFSHHDSLLVVLQSSAATIVWKRAHWRHPDTPVPRLQQLVEIFRDWQCTDIKAKVFALVGMAAMDSAIVPDYSHSTRKNYRAVMDTVYSDVSNFANLWSQVLALTERDCALVGREMLVVLSYFEKCIC